MWHAAKCAACRGGLTERLTAEGACRVAPRTRRAEELSWHFCPSWILQVMRQQPQPRQPELPGGKKRAACAAMQSRLVSSVGAGPCLRTGCEDRNVQFIEASRQNRKGNTRG